MVIPSKGKKSKVKKNIAIAILILILAAASAFSLEKKGIIDLYKQKINTPPEEKTTSEAPTAQEDFTEGGAREELDTKRNEGTVTDTGGDINQTPAELNGLVSPNGRITLYTPSKNSLFMSGNSVSGKSSFDKVSFRLIDNVSGVIAQGDLSVVNGSFSGVFDFKTAASEGRLDIYSVTPEGVEQENIEVPIRFK